MRGGRAKRKKKESRVIGESNICSLMAYFVYVKWKRKIKQKGKWHFMDTSRLLHLEINSFFEKFLIVLISISIRTTQPSDFFFSFVLGISFLYGIWKKYKTSSVCPINLLFLFFEKKKEKKRKTWKEN